MIERILLLGVTVFVIFLSLNPIVWLIYGSFLTTQPGLPGNLTLNNYVSVFSNADTYAVMVNSLVLSVSATLLAGFLSIPLAYLLSRTNIPGKRFFESIPIILLMVPGMLFAMGWSLLLGPRIGLINQLTQQIGVTFDIYSMLGMIFVDGIHSVPFVFLPVYSALQNMDSSLEESSLVSGASRWQTLYRVSLPMMKPAMMTGFFLSFIRSISELDIPLVIGLTSRIYVLTTTIYRDMSNIPPAYGKATATSSILLLMAMLFVYVYRRVTREAEKYVTVKGKGYLTTTIDMGKWRHISFSFGMTVFALSIGLPLGILILVSFFSAYHTPPWVQGDFTVKNYLELSRSPSILLAFANSFILATAGAFSCLILSALLAYVSVRSKIRGRGLAEALTLLPFSMPGIVIGVGLLWAYLALPLRIYGTLWILWIANTTRWIPFGHRSISTGFLQVHNDMEEASYISGASWGTTMRSILLPLVRPSMIAAWIFLSIAFFRELASSVLLYTPNTIVLSVQILSKWELNLWEQLSALGVLMTIYILAFTFISIRLGRTGIVA